MKAKKIPKGCLRCPSLSTAGIANGKYDRWCCKYCGAAPDKVGHCKQMGTYPKENDDVTKS